MSRLGLGVGPGVLGVRVRERVGSVADLHAADLIGELPPGGASIDVVVCNPTDSAIALGSRQRADLLDVAACERLGFAVATRRSGGGVVVIEPSSVVWIDVVVASVALDVRASMIWMGGHWAAALRGLADVDPVVHRGGLQPTPWSDLMCFAGLGPGEVMIDDRKLLGLSQRRTRAGARFQGMLYTRPVSIDPRQIFAIPVPDESMPPVATMPLGNAHVASSDRQSTGVPPRSASLDLAGLIAASLRRELVERP